MRNLKKNPSYSTMAACVRKLAKVTLPQAIGSPMVISQVSARSQDQNQDKNATIKVTPKRKTEVNADDKDVELYTTPQSRPSTRQLASKSAQTTPQPKSSTKRSSKNIDEDAALFKTPTSSKTLGPSDLAASLNSAGKKSKASTPSIKSQYVFLTTGLNEDQKIIFKASYNKIGSVKAILKTEYSSQVTHIISGCNEEGLCPRTVKYMRGVLEGKLVVSYEWFLASLSANGFVSEEAFLIRGDEVVGKATDAVQKSLHAHHQNLPSLFSGLSFYLGIGGFAPPAPTRKDLISLITAGGGTVITRKPSNDCIVITDESSVGCPWTRLLEAISYFEVKKLGQ